MNSECLMTNLVFLVRDALVLSLKYGITLSTVLLC